MLKTTPNWLMKTNNWISKNFGENPGKMLTWTGVIGWFLSSMAQVAAIAINDKIPKEQKLFLIPQELADAAVNITSFFLITKSFCSLTKNLVKHGKLIPISIKNKLNSSTSLENLLKTDKTVKEDFDKFEKGTDVLAQTIGSIVACNIVTPIIRNKIAAKRQKDDLQKYNYTRYSEPYTKPHINEFMGLKI